MTNENMQYGVVEAFSFRKGVVKIDGQWIHFSREAEETLRELKVGDSVGYISENKNLQWVEKSDVKVAPKPKPSTPTTSTAAVETRNRNIERQVALKAAVELAELYKYGSTGDCLNVAASFAAWIENGSSENVQLASRPASPVAFPRS